VRIPFLGVRFRQSRLLFRTVMKCDYVKGSNSTTSIADSFIYILSRPFWSIRLISWGSSHQNSVCLFIIFMLYLTLLNSVVLEKLNWSKIPRPRGIWVCITTFTRHSHWTLPWARQTQSTHSNTIYRHKINFDNPLFIYLPLDLPSASLFFRLSD
jgi:hypothetical protein